MGIYISIPRTKMGTKPSVISTLIMAIIFTIAAIVLIFPAIAPSDTDIVVSQDFYVDTEYDNHSIEYPYTTYVSGEIKNNTDKTLEDVEISFKFECDDGYSYTVYFNAGTLTPGQTYTIATEYETTADYYDIEDLSYSYNGCGTTEIDLVDFEDFITSIALGVGALIMWIVFAISMSKYKKNKNAPANTIASSSQVFTNATVGGQNITINGSANTNQQAAPTVNAAKTCPYCGSKIPAGESKCPGCGAQE